MSGEADQVPTELVADKYRLSRLLGRGGMGSVWEGVHVSLGTRVAVKFIESEYADSPDARNRFENEARAAATLTSKHVVQVYDHGVMPDGRPYIVMEYLAGEPLDSRLEAVGRLSVQDTVRIMLQVARALAKAHQAGIVHRDLKPENVFLVWDDEDNADVAKVVDFGIAKFTNADMGLSSSTRTGSVLGTPYFMSPEQARGLRSVDYRTDLWAMGVITYRCLVGVLPFSGEAVGDLLVKICTAPVPVPSQMVADLPPEFDAWFAKALDRDPGRRYGSAIEMAEALAACFGGRPAMGSYVNAGAATMPQMSPAHGAVFTSAAGTGGHGTPALPGNGIALAQSDVQTADPLQYTPPQGIPKKSAAGLVAVAIVGVLALVGAGIVAMLTLGGQSTATAATETEPSASADERAVAPEVFPTEAPEQIAKSEDPEVSASDGASKDEPSGAADASAAAPTPKSAPAPRRPPARPVAPRPQPTATTAPRPHPTSPPRTGGDVDVGY